MNNMAISTLLQATQTWQLNTYNENIGNKYDIY